MKKIITNLSTGEILKTIRKNYNLSQTEFAKKIDKTRGWQYLNESNNGKYYIDDLIKLGKIFNFYIIFKSNKYGIKLNLMDYPSKYILRFIREATNKNQSEFASTIGKSNDWQYCNEAGKTNYFTNDLFELARKHDFEIEIIFE